MKQCKAKIHNKYKKQTKKLNLPWWIGYLEKSLTNLIDTSGFQYEMMLSLGMAILSAVL